jgi:hypothetical protein
VNTNGLITLIISFTIAVLIWIAIIKVASYGEPKKKKKRSQNDISYWPIYLTIIAFVLAIALLAIGQIKGWKMSSAS